MENVAQPRHESLGRSVVNLRINAIHVACGALRPVSLTLENENTMSAPGNVRPIKSEAEFQERR